MRNNLGPCCTCLLEGGRHDEVPRGGGNKMARVLLTASQGREVATRGVVFPPLLSRRIGRVCYPDNRGVRLLSDRDRDG